MAEPRPNTRRKKIIRMLMIVTAVLGIAVIGIHIWFERNARTVLKQMVSSKSNGKLKLELSQLSFDLLSNTIQIDEADLVSVDTVTRPTTYNVKFRKLSFRVASFWPLLLQKKLLVDSIQLNDPFLTVVQWREDTSFKKPSDELSIPQQMGNLYNSMLDALEDFGINRIIITNATLSLVNKMKPGTEPVTVSNIYFNLARSDEARKRDEFIENEQDVHLRTTRQTIDLPGGRHRLSFKDFSLELFRKRIVLDSCTVLARPRTGSGSSYEIFFDKLLLIGVDFNAMYRYNLIRADSVYCENPLFDINLSPSDATSKNGASKDQERPDPGKIIRELTGDLDLAFVGVKDAGIHITIRGKTDRELFNSSKDDFEMRGLRISPDSATPVSVQRFDMLVQDYRLYNEDSSAAFSFDSIHFMNNKVVLNNFAVATSSTKSTLHNYRDFKIPYFELTGLDWYQLIFNQNLNAQAALMYRPVIHYIRRKPETQKKKTNIYESLRTLDNLMTLQKMDIIDGELDLKLGTTSLDLNHVNLGLYSDRLLQSTNNAGLRSAVERLSFSKGVIRFKDITARLEGVRSSRGDLVHAEKVTVSSSNKKINATLNGVFIRNMILDDQIENITVDGISWKNANIVMLQMPASKANKKQNNINLNDISGGNTRLQLNAGNTSISSHINSIKIASIKKQGTIPLQINGVLINGDRLSVKGKGLKVNTAAYQIGSEKSSFISQADIQQVKDLDTISIQSPRIGFMADINSILNKDIHLNYLEAESPRIRVIKRNPPKEDSSAAGQTIRIDRIVARRPDVHITAHKNDSAVVISIPRSDMGILSASGLRLGNGIQVAAVNVNTDAATVTMRNGQVIGVEKGKIDLDVSDIRLGRSEGKPAWSAVINTLHLQSPKSFSFGRNRLLLEQASVGNLNLSSEYLTDFDRLIKYNVDAWLRTATGYYIDSITTLKWYNAQYNYVSRTLSLDSFAYFPTQPRDSVVANTPYQTDYITFHSGPIKMTDFNLEKYRRDSSLFANSIDVTRPLITIFRDKQPPFLAGRIKPLPVDMIKNIKLPVSLQRVNLIDGLLSYTEKHARTRAEGTLHLARLNGWLGNIKNRNISQTDSLTLVINANLMDSALISLRVRESYADSLSGFLMTLRMRPTSLSFLNPVLAPLSNVKITSGTIDSLFLRAIGHEDLAIGQMKMYYHDLRIKLVSDGNPDKSSFGKKVLSFLANTLLIKKNNKGKTGLVYFERLKDRSFFNYIVKMTFSGMATSIGVKKNSKYRRKYKRELRERDLPPVDFE